MVYVKAVIVGIVTGLLAPMLVVLAVLLAGFRYAATGGGGIVGVSGGLIEHLAIVIVAVGFIAGFAWSLWRSKRAHARPKLGST